MANFAIRIIAGRRSKYLVLVFWLMVVVVVGPLAGKLSGAEHNDTKAWLPGNAESTKVIDLEAAFQSPNLMPAVVVYDRPGGLTARGPRQDRRRRRSPRVGGPHRRSGERAGLLERRPGR